MRPVPLDPELCYRAIESRDRRFDGCFVLAVRTTGVYCRPGCPAPLPRKKNCRFYSCPAAAEEAGFRPCLRCRPETVAGTPAWAGTAAAVSRALRLIDGGCLDRDGVEDLAGRVGLGGRQLRRLFEEHLGASPLSIARTRRVHFARRLLDQTVLPMTEIAHAAGFSSLRSFNQSIRDTFRRSPSDLRGGSHRARAWLGWDGSLARLSLRLPYRPPMDWGALLGFLAARAVPGIESVEGDRYLRTLRIQDATGWLAVEPIAEESALRITVPAHLSRHLLAIVEKAGRLFDLGADPARINAHLELDPRLRPLARRRPGLRVPGAWDFFEIGVRAILGQQVTVRGATTLSGRLVARFGEPLLDAPGPGLTHLYPAPASLACAPLESIGLPRARADAIRSFAKAASDGALDFGPAPDPASARKILGALAGIGPWTVEYLGMRGLADPDAFPAGDLGLRKALADAGRLPSQREVEARARAWSPWRAYAAMHLWSTLKTNPRARSSARKAAQG